MANKRLKTYNKILKILFFKKFLSRIEISKTLNLTKPLITNITKKLIEKNIIKEKQYPIYTEKINKTIGKRKQYLTINENFKFVFGATLEKNLLKVALSNLNGEIITKNYFKVPEKEKIFKTLNIIVKSYEEILEKNYILKKDILAFGFCLDDEIKNKNLNYIKDFLKSKLKTSIHIKSLRYGLAISEILFFFKKNNILKENNMFIFIENKIVAFFLERKNIYDNYELRNSNFEKIIYFKDIDNIECLGNIFKNLKEYKKISEDIKIKNFLEILYKTIYNSAMLTKIDNIIIYGDIFKLENFKKFIDKTPSKDFLKNVEIIYKNSKMLKNQKFLTGCAISIEASFLNLEYFENKEL